jgi:hypothetical protein
MPQVLTTETPRFQTTHRRKMTTGEAVETLADQVVTYQRNHPRRAQTVPPGLPRLDLGPSLHRLLRCSLQTTKLRALSHRNEGGSAAVSSGEVTHGEEGFEAGVDGARGKMMILR